MKALLVVCGGVFPPKVVTVIAKDRGSPVGDVNVPSNAGESVRRCLSCLHGGVAHRPSPQASNSAFSPERRRVFTFAAILAYLVANLTLALYIAYRRPTRAWADAPAFFVALASVWTIPAMVIELMSEVRR